MAAIYSGGAVALGGLYFYTKHTLEKVQPVPDEWSFKQKILALAGANHHEQERYDISRNYYQDLINELILESDGSFKDLSNKSPAWLAGYADVVIRLGLSKNTNISDEREDAKQALESGCSIPYGQSGLKARAALKLGIFEREDGNVEKAQEYMEQAIGYNLTPEKFTRDPSTSSIIVNPTTILTNDQVDPLIELAKMYVSQKKIKDALNLFLSVQRGMKEHARQLPDDPRRSVDDPRCLEPLIMAYIGEILWSLGNKKDAIIWEEGSFYDSNEKSRNRVECGMCAQMAATNVSKMYKHLKMTDESEKFKKMSEEQYIAPMNSYTKA